MKTISYAYMILAIVFHFKPSHAESFNPSPQTWVVDAETAACDNSDNQCLLVKQPGRKEFEIFNESIEGFDYEKGYTYTIVVKQQLKDPPIAVGESLFKYVLVKINTKKAVYKPVSNAPKIIQPTSINTSSPLDQKWYLRKIKDEDGSSLVTDDNVVWMEINTFNDKLKGIGACNPFEGVIRTNPANKFEASKLTAGLSSCSNKKLENLFLDALQRADYYEIRSGVLILSSQGKYLMEFAADPGQKAVTDAASGYKPSYISTKESELVMTKTTNSSTTTTSNDIDELQKQVEELQKQLAAKKQKEAEEQKAKEEKLKRADEEKQKVEQEKLKKLKEIEELKKQLAEKEKEISSESASKSTSKTTTEKAAVSASIPQPDEYDIPYYLENNTLKEMERSAVSLKLEKNNHITFEAKNMESPCQLKEKNLPRIIIKLKSDETPSELFTLLTVETTKNSRIIPTGKMVGGKTKDISKSIIDIEFKKIKGNIYEILLPADLPVGEYAFLPLRESGNLNISNPIDFDVTFFGIEENKDAGTTISSTVKSTTTTTSSGSKQKTFIPLEDADIPLPTTYNRPYFIKGDELTDMERSATSLEIDKNGYITFVTDKMESPCQLKEKNLPQVIIRVKSNESPSELFTLMSVESTKTSRIIPTGKKIGGTPKNISNVVVKIDFRKIKNELFEIILPSNLPIGEYAFLPTKESNNISLTSPVSFEVTYFGVEGK
ncbi:MAG: DUF4377 domain-containing protein [Chitinophagales bacterium]